MILLIRLLSCVQIKNLIISAIERKEFADLEDCLQEECSVSIGADYIVTRNVKDFTTSRVPAILPNDFLEEYMKHLK